MHSEAGSVARGEDKNRGFERYREDSSSCKGETGGFSEIFQVGMREF